MGIRRRLTKVLKVPNKPHGYLTPRKRELWHYGQHGIVHDFPPGFQRISRSARGCRSPREIPYPHPLVLHTRGVYPIKTHLTQPFLACGWIMAKPGLARTLLLARYPLEPCTLASFPQGSQAGRPEGSSWQGCSVGQQSSVCRWWVPGAGCRTQSGTRAATGGGRVHIRGVWQVP